MQKLSNSRAISHRDLVELAERLMNETPDPERFLPAYDAALSADNDALLVAFCRTLQKQTGARRAA